MSDDHRVIRLQGDFVLCSRSAYIPRPVGKASGSAACRQSRWSKVWPKLRTVKYIVVATITVLLRSFTEGAFLEGGWKLLTIVQVVGEYLLV